MRMLLGPWDGDTGLRRIIAPARLSVGAGDEDRPQVVYLACGKYWILERYLARGESALEVAFGGAK